MDGQSKLPADDLLLEIRGLKTHFFTQDGVVKAVDGIDLRLKPEQVLGLVGESGCGKSVTSLSIMRLVGHPGRIVEGEIFFEGQDLLKLSEAEMNRIRGNRISMIFQQPQSCLNPVFSGGRQVTEVMDIHTGQPHDLNQKRTLELFRLVGIPDPEKKIKAYPHEMSGGQAQRVMIAMALAMRPKVLIADEPTTALDVTIQAQILDLIRDMREQLGTAVILITHDLGVIAEMADEVAVMYAGQIVEQADVETLFERPLHPYTQGLLGAIPVMGRRAGALQVIPGIVPDLVDLPPGCRFAPRCAQREKYGLAICDQKMPEMRPVENGGVRCWLYQSAPGHQAPLWPRRRNR